MIIAPFPWVGGKRRIAGEVWRRFGDVHSYCEPFAGSCAVLLARPDWHTHRREVIGDLSCYVINAWRSLAWSPDDTAYWADWPISHADLTARRHWLIQWAATAKPAMLTDPMYHDPQAAGWWIWGTSCWIGESSYAQDSRGASGKTRPKAAAIGVNKGKIPEVAGLNGVNALDSRPMLSKRSGGGGCGVNGAGDHGTRPSIGKRNGVFATGEGPKVGADNGGAAKAGPGTRPQIDRPPGVCAYGTIPKLTADNGVHAAGARLRPWFAAIANRLRLVHLLHGDWTQAIASNSALGTAPRDSTICGVFLDPPYSSDERTAGLYDQDDGGGVAAKARDWAIANGNNPRLRIAICAGRAGLDMPPDWTDYVWQASGHVEGGRDRTEHVYFSPHCLVTEQGRLL